MNVVYENEDFLLFNNGDYIFQGEVPINSSEEDRIYENFKKMRKENKKYFRRDALCLEAK